MSQVNLPNLIAKLDSDTKRALELAAGDAMNSHYPSIELEHWLLQIIYKPASEVSEFFAKQKIDTETVIKELSGKLAKLSKCLIFLGSIH